MLHDGAVIRQQADEASRTVSKADQLLAENEPRAPGRYTGRASSLRDMAGQPHSREQIAIGRARPTGISSFFPG